MSTSNVYRENAQECLRIAETTHDEGDRHLWITMAHSWIRLAELMATGSPDPAQSMLDESAG
jgi:hypothetical protein